MSVIRIGKKIIHKQTDRNKEEQENRRTETQTHGNDTCLEMYKDLQELLKRGLISETN